MGFEHIPVLLKETIHELKINPDGVYVDCTTGGGGHSEEIVKRLNYGKLICIDQDLEALEAAKIRLRPWEKQIHFIHSNFVRLKDLVQGLGIDKLDGILMDIGVSSHQLDEADRGFSYHEDAPLDMRMDQQADIATAADIINSYAEEDLARIFWTYGEERWGKRVAAFIVEERKTRRIEGASELVDIIRRAIPRKARPEDKHPARKIFQALRIEVNRELEVLDKVIEDGIDLLRPRGRFCIISFHSLEDRIVKNQFKEKSTGCKCPPDFPVCICGRKPEVEIITKKPITATDRELDINPRARSAKLRVIEKL